jgi:hypothetical protein
MISDDGRHGTPPCGRVGRGWQQRLDAMPHSAERSRSTSLVRPRRPESRPGRAAWSRTHYCLTHLGPPLAGRQTSAGYARSQVLSALLSSPLGVGPTTLHDEEPVAGTRRVPAVEGSHQWMKAPNQAEMSCLTQSGVVSRCPSAGTRPGELYLLK